MITGISLPNPKTQVKRLRKMRRLAGKMKERQITNRLIAAKVDVSPQMVSMVLGARAISGRIVAAIEDEIAARPLPKG